MDLRWNCLKNDLGIPDNINLEVLLKVYDFAYAELGRLVLFGGSSLNTGLPSTDNQKNRSQQLKENEKKRVAAARVVQPPPEKPKVASAQVPPPPQKPDNWKEDRTATTSNWAPPCNSWTNKGVCKRGINCEYKHEGWLKKDYPNRCVNCGVEGHSPATCTAGGGGKDPNRAKAWDAYKTRRAEGLKKQQQERIAQNNGQGGDDGKNGKKEEASGKGKGGKKGKGKGNKNTGKGQKDFL